MKKQKGLLVAVYLTAISLSAIAQPLSWEECVKLSSEKSPTLTAAAASVDAARSSVSVANSDRLPQLSAGASANQSYSDVDSDESTSYGAFLKVEQSVYDGGSTKASIQSAEAELNSKLASFDGSRVDLTYDLRCAFINVLYAQENVKLLAQIEERRESNVGLIELLYESGSEHKGSLASAQASLFDAQVQGAQAARALSVNLQTLARTMGISSLPEHTVVEGSLEYTSKKEDADIENLAFNTPEYTISKASSEVASAQLAQAKSSYYPDINLTGSVGRYGDEDDMFNENRWSAGLELSFPLWTGGQTRSEVEKATAKLLEAQANEADVLNERIRIITEAEQSLEDAIDNVDVQAKYVEASEIRAKIATQQYEDGLLSFDDWNDIEDNLIEKKEALLNAQRDILLSEASWWEAIGFDVFSQSK